MKIHSRIALAAILLATSTPINAQAHEPQIPEPTISSVAGRNALIPFELFRGNRMILNGSINGVETAMILDSGAGVTALDIEFAKKLGLTGGQKIDAQGTGGQQDAELFQNVTIEAGNLKISGATVVAIDLSNIAKAIGRPIPVILGRELFMSSVIGIDFDKREMTLSPATGFVAPAGATEVKLKREGTLHYMSISLDGLPPVDAAIDLGNGGALSISREYHEAHPQFAALPYAVSMGGGVGGLHEMKRTTLPKVNVAGFELTSVPTDLGSLSNGPYANKANAGIQLFKPFKLTLDLGHDRLWLKRNDKLASFARDRTGLVTLLEGDHFNVLFVTPGSAADKAGLKQGDRLTAIGGVAVSPGFFSGPQGDWFRGEAGSKIDVTKSDGGTITLVLADYY